MKRRCDSGVIRQSPWHHSCMSPIPLRYTTRYTRAKQWPRLRLRLTLLVWASWRSWTRPWFELTSIPFRKRLGGNRLLNERVGGFLKRARGPPAWQRVYVKPSDLHPSRLQMPSVNFIQFPIAVEPDGEARETERRRRRRLSSDRCSI